MPLPGTEMPAETRGRISLLGQGWGLARAAPSWQGGWVISQAELDSRRTKSLSITAHVALTETIGGPGGVGEKGREEKRREEGGRWHQQWPPALNLLPRSPLITSVEAVHALLGASEVFMG